jgi:hypothetical protein
MLEVLDWYYYLENVVTYDSDYCYCYFVVENDKKLEISMDFLIRFHYYFQYDCKRSDKFEGFDDFLNMWSIDPKKNDSILKEYLTD